MNLIKLFEEIQQHAVWKDEWVLKLFIWCCFQAEKSDCISLDRALKRGQFITTRNCAADDLECSPSKWYRGMQVLEDIGSVTMEACSTYTVVTVVNYAKYQDVCEPGSERPYPEAPIRNPRSGAEQLVAKFRFPDRYNTPELTEAVKDWAEHFYSKEGRRVTNVALLSALNMAASYGWDAAKVVMSIHFSISKDAKSWRNPDYDYDQPRPASGNGNGNGKHGPGQVFDGVRRCVNDF